MSCQASYFTITIRGKGYFPVQALYLEYTIGAYSLYISSQKYESPVVDMSALSAFTAVLG